MRRLNVTVIVLELYALLLTFFQLPGGIRTDEAKYLLSIPYPHPPILRTIFSWTAGMPGQEFFWRFLIASLMVQSVWLLWDIGYVLPAQRRLALAAGWLLGTAFIVQSGTIMMAPLTGLFGLVCVWLSLRAKPISRDSAALIGCLWFFGLFSAYQTVLYLPLLIGVLRTAHVSPRRIAVYLGIPLLLLGLYTLSNPLALASILKVSVQDAPMELGVRTWNILFTFLVAGGGILTIVGICGVLLSGRIDLTLTFVLMTVFICLSSQGYYAILLTPLLVAGLFTLLCRRKLSSNLFLPLHACMSVFFVSLALPPFHRTPARATMHYLASKSIAGPVLIAGYFGHEWQYESASQILVYSQELSSVTESKAIAIVCTKKTCEDEINGEMWVRSEGAPVEVWIRK